jgi:hypothetical protein
MFKRSKRIPLLCYCEIVKSILRIFQMGMPWWTRWWGRSPAEVELRDRRRVERWERKEILNLSIPSFISVNANVWKMFGSLTRDTVRNLQAWRASLKKGRGAVG